MKIKSDGTALQVLLGLSVGALSCSAAKADDKIGALEEIIVVAQKRSQDIESVGIAMQAFTSGQLESFGVSASVDLAKILSNVAVSGSYGGQMSQFTIRGITQNDFNDHVESVVALYVDDTYVAMQQGQTFATFDLDHVEALKGPQGTLFGRNATAGLVHYVTKRPTDTLESSLKVSYGSYGDVRVEPAISGPLAETVSGRLSGLFERYDGYIKNVYPNQTYVPSSVSFGGTHLPGAGGDLGGQKYLGAVRGQLEFKLGDSSKLLTTVNWSESVASSAPYLSTPSVTILNSAGVEIDDIFSSPTNVCQAMQNGACVHGAFSSTPGGVRPVPGGDFFGYRNPNSNGRKTSCDYCFDNADWFRTYGATANFATNFRDVSLTSITDYKNFAKFFSLDIDGGPTNQFYWHGQSNENTLSEELRLNGSTGRSNWVAGAYFLSIRNTSVHGIGALSDSVYPVANWEQPRIADLRTKSYSLFGQDEFAISDSVSLTLGLRGTEERKKYGFEVLFVDPATTCSAYYWCFAPAISFPGFSQNLYTADSSSTLWNWKAQVDWHATKNMMLYAGVTQGMKAGSFNAGGPPLPPAEIPYKPEKLISYESGLKSTFWDDRARLNVAAFYYDYRDYQEARWLGFSSLITNQNANFYGAEADINAKLTPDLEVMLNAGVQDNKVKGLNVAGVTKDVEAAFAPRQTLAAMAKYTVPSTVFDKGKLSFQVDGNYHAAVWDNPDNFTADRLPGYALVNAHITWVSASGDLQIQGNVENLTNKVYRTVGFDLSQICGCNLEAYGKPRWASVDIRYHFK